jgi:two-component sensor histidine kinase
MTDWLLSEPMKDIQAYVVHTRQPKIVPKASEDPLLNQKVVAYAGITNMAVVPVLDSTGVAIGTIHVERQDKTVPSQEEVDDLVLFGRQLARAIQQAERANLLQAALDKQSDPLLFVDSHVRSLYANRPACHLLGGQPGWQDSGNSSSRTSLQGEIRDLVTASIEKRQRVVKDVTGIGSAPDYRGEVHCEVIYGWNRHISGAMIHITDKNDLHRVFEAVRLVAETQTVESAETALLLATQKLGYRWGRLYIIPPDEPNSLVSKQSFGFSNKRTQVLFDSGGIRLPTADDSNSESWKSVKERLPLVFCLKPEMADGAIYTNQYGLDAINTREPGCPKELEKHPGDFWIDFPLAAGKSMLGKITLHCDENLTPEQFGFLKVLCEMTAGVFAQFEKQREHDRRERWVCEAAERAMATTAHNLASRLGPMPVLLSRYRRLEGTGCSGLSDLNDQMETTLSSVLNTVKRAKERLTTPILHVEAFDLDSMISALLYAALPNGSSEMHCSVTPLSVQMDPQLLDNALHEMIANSHHAVGASLHITIRLDVVEHAGEEWVELVYEDNGPGIPEKNKNRIFDDFFSHRPGKKQGIGLGLSFVRRAVEAHSGEVSEVGEPGAGVRFRVLLPRFAERHHLQERIHV